MSSVFICKVFVFLRFFFWSGQKGRSNLLVFVSDPISEDERRIQEEYKVGSAAYPEKSKFSFYF